MITNHSIGNFLLIGSQCFTNRQFMALGNLPIAVNGLPLVPIGNDIWAGGGGSGGLLKQTKSVKHDESYLPTVPWHKQTPPFLKSSQNFDPRGLGFKNLLRIFGISPT